MGSIRILHRLRAAALALTLGLGAAASNALVFAVNEGVSYNVPDDQVRAKYAAITADLSRLLKQPVSLEPVASYNTLREGLAKQSYDLAMVHPAHLSIVAIKQSGYKLLVVTKGFQEYRASFLVKADTPLKSLAELKGRKIGAPDADSITAWMVRATLRDEIGDAKLVDATYTRYQDAVPFFVENGFVQAGATASGAVVKGWKDKGGKVLAQSKAVPIKHIIASGKLSAEQQALVRDYLLALDANDEGRKKLEPTKYKGFATYDEQQLLALGTWLGL